MDTLLKFHAASGRDSLWLYLTYLLGIWLLYILVVVVYRITCHPLAKFPGPKLAKATYLYEFWFDVVLGGRYTHQIRDLHEKYGM